MLAQARLRDLARAAPLLALVLSGAGLAAGCAPRRAEAPAVAAPSATPPAGGDSIAAGMQVYEVDPGSSIVTLRVYRAGPLARLGHNHVITSTDETGVAWSGGEPGQSGFVVRVPVAALVVDDPATRAAAGPDFPGELAADAREGTTRNMLRPEVLDGGRYPEIVVRADALRGTWEQVVAEARVTLRGQTRPMQLPLSIERDDAGLVARGSFQVLQSEFGMAPFSAAGGAIRVADAVDVSFEIRARAR